jgi:hypothetical protein
MANGTHIATVKPPPPSSLTVQLPQLPVQLMMGMALEVPTQVGTISAKLWPLPKLWLLHNMVWVWHIPAMCL